MMAQTFKYSLLILPEDNFFEVWLKINLVQKMVAAIRRTRIDKEA